MPGSNSPGLGAVTATGPRSAWAFESTSSRPAAWRLSGSRWIQVPFPGNAGAVISSAASTSPDDVWAVESNGVPGNGARQRILSWSGTGWAVTAGSFPGSVGDVVPLSLHDAWFFDGLTPGGATWHYTGYRWSRVPSGNGLTDGSALSPHSIWAIGATDVAHWNGHAWSRTWVKALLAGCPVEPALCGPGLWHVKGAFYFLICSSALCLGAVVLAPQPAVQGTALGTWVASAGLARFLLAGAYRSPGGPETPTE